MHRHTCMHAEDGKRGGASAGALPWRRTGTTNGRAASICTIFEQGCCNTGISGRKTAIKLRRPLVPVDLLWQECPYCRPRLCRVFTAVPCFVAGFETELAAFNPAASVGLPMLYTTAAVSHHPLCEFKFTKLHSFHVTGHLNVNLKGEGSY